MPERPARAARAQRPPRASELHRFATSISLGKDDARVRLLIQQHGTDVRVVAVSGADRRAALHTTLDQVRRELALRGVRLHIETHEEQPAC